MRMDDDETMMECHPKVNIATVRSKSNLTTMKRQPNGLLLRILIVSAFSCSSLVRAWAWRSSSLPRQTIFTQRDGLQQRSTTLLSLIHKPSRSLTTALSASTCSLVVISPPGGVGEVAAVQAASRGAAVRWFVVSGPQDYSSKNQMSQPGSVALSAQALQQISEAGGEVQLAGASASSLLVSREDPNSALPAVSTWCGVAESMICTWDGMEDSMGIDSSKRLKESELEAITTWKDAVKVAALEGSSAIRGRKIAIISALEDDVSAESDQEGKGGGVGDLVGSLLGAIRRPTIPESLPSAMSARDESSVIKLRHGTLFGTPESSPKFTALVGGPKRVPELCEEYTMRSVRVDPTLSGAGNLMMGSNTRTSRHAVGEVAALLALGQVQIDASGLDVCISSQRGSDPVPVEVWDQEFQRVQGMMQTTGGAQLFSADFASVPSVKRLADWLATKWAPAILRTYDIAAIRVGARPVYANRLDDESTVEIVWQQLVDFNSVTVGKMVIRVSESGLIATRGPGDASKGFGSVSRKPLAGEDVLVRRLSEAVSQAIEKGLANKPLVAKKPEPKRVATPAPVTSIQDAGTVVATVVSEPTTTISTAIAEPDSTTTEADQGPRQAGARRSTERKRGKRRRDDNPSKP